MAEIQAPTGGSVLDTTSTPCSKPAEPQPSQPRGPSLHQIYALPAPIRTFPLPAFYPNNPVSLFYFVYAWIGQVFRPPPFEPVVHQGVWSPETSSVHITDEKSTRALWEQGFYGKGNLSRSEPNWLKREQVRRGQQKAHVSEILTVQRREERMRAKWERARLEQEAIRQTRLEEARETEARLNALNTTPTRKSSPKRAPATSVAPVNPALFFSVAGELPKDQSSVSSEPLLQSLLNGRSGSGIGAISNHGPPLSVFHAPVDPATLLALPNSLSEQKLIRLKETSVNKEKESGLAKRNSGVSQPLAPVGPAELLALPNSDSDLRDDLDRGVFLNGITPAKDTNNNPGDLNVSIPNGVTDVSTTTTAGENSPQTNGHDHSEAEVANDHVVDGDDKQPASPSSCSEGSEQSRPSRRRKSVRFSPKVESTTFQLSDPPSPNFTTKFSERSMDNNGTTSEPGLGSPLLSTRELATASDAVIMNKEHLQLMPEEAFFLSFGLGVLRVIDPSSGKQLSEMELFTRFRQHSYFPPRIGPDEPELQPDDGFLVHYCVYHHFRSLGWVPRGGIKFGVDWLLYTRGPVFDHAEFGLIVIPSYSDPLWKEAGKKDPEKTWSWLHATVRVLSHVTKSLVLVYVDVPSPSRFEQALEKGFTEAFKLYKVREVMVKRWSSNRNR